MRLSPERWGHRAERLGVAVGDDLGQHAEGAVDGEGDLSAQVSVVFADHEDTDQPDVLCFTLVGREDGHAQRQLLEGTDGGRQAVDAFFHQLLTRVVVVEAVQPGSGNSVTRSLNASVSKPALNTSM